jgi:hypothetical protein
MVRSFERRLNAPRPNPVPPTVAKTRAYRVLGWIAAAGINLKLPIDIRSGFSDSSGMDGSENRPIMEWFPQAESRTPP